MSSTVSENNLAIKGHCACRMHTFTIHGRPTNVANCHCSLCRRHSGMAFSTYFTVEQTQYEGPLATLVSEKYGGESKGVAGTFEGKGTKKDTGKDAGKEERDVISYTSDIAERFFCSHCGTPLLMRYFCTPSTLHIPLGLLVAPAPRTTSPTTTSTSSEDTKMWSELKDAFKPRQDIWISSRAWWVSSTDEEGREQFEQDDEEFLKKCQMWRERAGR